jgi:hypothetical protein
MSVRESLERVLETLPEEQVREVLVFAESLKDDAEWKHFGQAQLARAYGDDEPEYSMKDLKEHGP